MTNTSATPKRRCPDCGSALIKRASKMQHPLMSKTYLICKNAVCGATFTGVDEITHRLSPSSRPNPDVHLPFAPTATRHTVLLEQGMPAETEEPSHLGSNALEARP